MPAWPWLDSGTVKTGKGRQAMKSQDKNAGGRVDVPAEILATNLERALTSRVQGEPRSQSLCAPSAIARSQGRDWLANRAGGGSWRWPGALGAATLAMMASACQSSAVMGSSDCYVILRLDADLDDPVFHISGVRADVIDPECPPLTKVNCTFWDDRNGDMKIDPGEPLTRGTFAESNPPSHTLTVGAFSSRRPGNGRSTCWECVAINSNNVPTRFGGRF